MSETIANIAKPRPGDAAVADPYAPFAQLIRMLLPRAGSVLLYDAAGELLWCSDGCERLDLHELSTRVDAATGTDTRFCGTVHTSSAGTRAFIAPLKSALDLKLGTLVVELPNDDRREFQLSMLASMLRPVLACLSGHLDLERTAVEPRPMDDLDLLLDIDESPRADSDSLEGLLRQCVRHFECDVGALAVPEKNLLLAFSSRPGNSAADDALTRTHKNLLAWAQLSQRAMVVNRTRADDPNDSPHKILAAPLRDGYDRVVGVFALFRDAAGPDFEQRDERMLELICRKTAAILDVRYDPLTALSNRQTFEQRAQRCLDQEPPARHALLFIDLDGLEKINATFGYLAGDEVLQRAAALIRNEVGAMGFAARLGGDKFAACLASPRPGTALSCAQRILDSMSGLSYLQDADALPISATVGMTSCEQHGESLTHALARAELACKQAKGHGGNQLAVFETGRGDAPEQRRALAYANLQSALRENRIHLEAQAINSLYAAGGDFGWEIYLRVRDSQGLALAPNRFIAAAERYRLMPALDRWVTSAALDQLATCSELARGLRFAFNVSGQSLEGDDFSDFLLQRIAASGLSPELFCVEIREAAAASRLESAERFCRRVSEAGVRIALDDFGCGLTSIAHLRHLPVDYLKIDGGLIRRMETDRVAESIVVAAVQVARALDLQTIAEHVESESVRQKLVGLGVDYGQGYAIAPIEPLATVLEQIGRNASSVRRSTG